MGWDPRNSFGFPRLVQLVWVNYLALVLVIWVLGFHPFGKYVCFRVYTDVKLLIISFRVYTVTTLKILSLACRLGRGWLGIWHRLLVV